MGVIRTLAFSVKDKSLNAIQHSDPAHLMLSPQRRVARSVFHSDSL